MNSINVRSHSNHKSFKMKSSFSIIVLISIAIVNDFFSKTQSQPKSLIESSQCSLELQTIDLNAEYSTSMDTIRYYPSCMKVARCSGCCSGGNFLYEQLYGCFPTGTIYKDIIQYGQTIDKFARPGQNHIKIKQRKVKVAIHTGCFCGCNNNPLGDCYYKQSQRFNNLTCKCECLESFKQIEIDCGKRFTFSGPMFWDKNRCECRCPQYYFGYIQNRPESNPVCLPGSRFDHKYCR